MKLTLTELSNSSYIIVLVPYGSHVYGTNDYSSDTDFIMVVQDGIDCDDQYSTWDTDYSVFSKSHFQKLLDDQYISAIEAFFTTPVKGSFKEFSYKVNKSKLRESISQRASNSFVKCKKKLTVETGEERIGMKSLFHSLRMLQFGIQLATTGHISNFSCANQYWEAIKDIGPTWSLLNETLKPIYNQLSTDFVL